MIRKLLAWLRAKFAPPAVTPAKKFDRGAAMARLLARMQDASGKKYTFPVLPPTLPPGVVPPGTHAAVAMDSSAYAFASQISATGGFPGYAYLANLATRAEFRQMASALATELTREWIKMTSKDNTGGTANEKISQIEEELKRLGVRGVMSAAAEHDALFGRGQIYIDVGAADPTKPLILSSKTVAKGSLKRIAAIEPMWTTPLGYNSLDPVAPDFYRPSEWFVLGKPVHASRLATVISRPVPDMLKPAYNFGGISLSQLAEPYVDNWLRTRQSVSDLINNFSITVLSTAMGQVLEGDENGTDLMKRAELFTAMRSNKGLMVLDKDTEELTQINTSLGGLHELQAQAQEQMCSVSRLPAIVLTGISPSGLNASSDGEIRVFYDWIAAQQEANWREPLETIIKVIQLSLFGEIDPAIGFEFVPLYQMTPKELSEIREADQRIDVAYVTAGILDPSEPRERLARNPDSGYQGLDADVVLVPPTDDLPEDAQ